MSEGDALLDALEQLFSALARIGSGLADEPALTVTQQLILLELVTSGPLRLGRLADRIGAVTATVSRAMNGLVGAGIVTREPDPDDRRAVLHRITAKGRARVVRRQHEVAATLDNALARVARADRVELLRLLETLNEAIDTRNSAPSVRYATVLASR